MSKVKLICNDEVIAESTDDNISPDVINELTTIDMSEFKVNYVDINIPKDGTFLEQEVTLIDTQTGDGVKVGECDAYMYFSDGVFHVDIKLDFKELKGCL